MANVLTAPYTGISPKQQGITATEQDLTAAVPSIASQAFVAVGNDVDFRNVEIVAKLKQCLNRLRETSLATGGTLNYLAKIDINDSSGQIVLALDAATTFAETEVGVGYGPAFIPANRVGLSGYVVPFITYLIDYFHELYLKDNTDVT